MVIYISRTIQYKFLYRLYNCTIVKQEKNLIEFACISVTGESFPVVIEYQEKKDRSIPIRARSKNR